MKPLLIIFVFALPLHALIVTYLKCKLLIDTNIIRFWKEIIIIILLAVTFFWTLKRYKFNLSKLYKNNYLLWTITAFIICSIVFLYFPFFEFKKSSFLGFKYDVFFLFAFLIWLYLWVVKQNLEVLMKTLFWVTWLIIIIFLPWYLLWDISALTSIFWYSGEVSAYNPNTCISFAQNVNGEHRFQGSFWWPIRFSVFLATFYFLYLWFVLDRFHNKDEKLNLKNHKLNALIIIPSLLVISSIFFSYSKTSVLWFLFGIILFIYLVRKIKLNKKLNKKFIAILSWVAILPIILIWIFKKDLFLHLWSVLNRFDNLSKSVEMFFYNPIWYWLGIAWPASQIWKSIESAWSRQIATSTVTKTHIFLPENWYVQILLEQWIVWLSLFISVLVIIWVNIFNIAKNKKDYTSICLFISLSILCFMALFTHSFEESATSYILFLILWAYISKNKVKAYNNKKK